MLSVMINSSVVNKTAKTKERIDAIYKAMGTYLLKNKHLPCPAPITYLKTNADYGKAGGTTGTCYDQDGVYGYQNSAYGMVPVNDLGLTTDFAEDGFGSKFGYVVYKSFTNESGFAVDNASLSSSVGIYVKQQGNHLINNLELPNDGSRNAAAFAIISYGANKFGSFGANSSTQNIASSSDAEKYNYPTDFGFSSPNYTAVFQDESPATSKIVLQASVNSSGGAFDDVLFYKSRNDIVRDFDALFLVKCPVVNYLNGTSDINYVKYGSNYISWSSGGRYGQNVVADNDSTNIDPNIGDTPCPSGWTAKVKYPARKCGAFGVWEAGGDNPSIVIPCASS